MRRPLAGKVAQIAYRHGCFLSRWTAREGAQVNLLYLRFLVVAKLIDQPAGKITRALENHFTVHHLQGLRRDSRIGTLDAVWRHPGQIENLQQGSGGGTALEHVDGTPPPFLWRPFRNNLTGRQNLHRHGGAELGWVELTSYLQDGVVQLFGVHAP